ncbi:MAG: HEAT repeat domain-containing protein [Polyangiaceae bacterium]|nr:HEAT repeat domain-containing protein [Polyangiaceae bacterium]
MGSRTHSILIATVCAVVFGLVSLLGRSAFADDAKIAFLADKLKADDFRVRTNAALALGATNEDNAVQPLCRALSDENEVVRQAAAAGMKRLGRAQGIACLRERLGGEGSDAVRLQLTRAIETLEAARGGSGGGGGSGEPKNNAQAKYYVALSAVQNRSGKAQTEVDAAVLAAVKKRLENAAVFQMAPDKETPAAAKANIAKRKLKGFYLSISVDPFDYASGTKASVRIAIFTYPNKDLRGESPGKARSSASKGDKDAENRLLAAAAESALEAFVQGVDQF